MPLLRSKKQARRGSMFLYGMGGGFYPGTNLNPDAFYDASRGVYTNGATALTSASSQYFSIADATPFVSSTTYSVAFWGKGSTTNGVGATTNISGVPGAWAVYPFADNSVQVWWYDGSQWGYVNKTTNSFTLANYNHFCLTVSGGTATLYVNGTANALTISTVTSMAATGFRIGRALIPGEAYANGSFANVRYWTRALSASDAAADYNSGSGETYSQMTAAMKVSLVSSYDFRSQNDLIYDSYGSNTLTAVNGPTYAAGVATELVQQSGDPVSMWLDQSVNLVHQYQTTGSLRPIFRYWNGVPAVVFQNGQRMASSLSVAWGPDATHGVSYRLTDVPIDFQGFIGNRPVGQMSYVYSTGWAAYTDTSGGGFLIPIGGSGNDITSNNYYLYLRNGSATDTIRKNGVDLGLPANARVIPSTTGVLYLGVEATGVNELNGYMFNSIYLSRRLSVSETTALESWMAGALPPAALGSIWADNGDLWSSMGNPWVGAQP